MGFVALAVWRIASILISRDAVPAPPSEMIRPKGGWPRYTMLIALHDEAEVVGQLITRLAKIDYPPDRLEALLLLEAHDGATIAAAAQADRPHWMRIVVVPPGAPQTKPRALNFGLAQARGGLVTIYDAEDDPDPFQLREAAARFAADTPRRLACLQAPLRIRRRGCDHAAPFLDRQFAVEYASLFEVALPALARLGLPFPLGGTSNHFRADVLRAVGGWDAWNVTEDADLGFRLWRGGWTLGVLSRPTYETPPGDLELWLPQRTRWLKGYMQTWGVHTRSLAGLGLRGAAALTLTLGVGLASAAIHAATLAWVMTAMLVAATAGLSPGTPVFGLCVLVLGAAAAWLQGKIGAMRAHVPYSATDMMAAPAYWSLLSLAFVHAAWRLVREPFAWDKTTHFRDGEPEGKSELEEALIKVDAGRQAA
ncbi:glycosyltransferase [Brevundimonas goettingensis]|uniref:Glycosyltransferase n=2 Tax=Brevundimonas goettingensis TaxID=2774190 RepID=A0A975C3M5_9CAUL|nr:glycosyltransferase [Brevundimonas goettingensis]